MFIDPDLLQDDEVWVAAGTWHDVFGIEPHPLVAASSHRRHARLIPRAQYEAVDSDSTLEDWRGVDVGQIREAIRLKVRERVRVRVAVANVLLSVQERARRARHAEVV